MLLDQCRTAQCERCNGTGKDINHVEIGQRLKARRLKKGLALREIARRTGFTPPYVHDLEYGRRLWNERLIEAYMKAVNA